MLLEFEPQAFADLEFWRNNNPKKLAKIFDLIESIKHNPKAGIGKPEALRGNYSGYWSRRIDKEHRLVYKIELDKVIFIQAKYHYDK